VDSELIVEQLFPQLITGNRATARATAEQIIATGVSPETLTHEGYWPLLDMINTLHRNDQLTSLAHHYSTRLLRSMVDQAQALYTQKERRNRRVMLFCAETEADDLAAQIVADLVEADGYEMFFGGGGVAWDEVMQEASEQKPDVLLLFSSSGRDAPHIRVLIDTIREIGSCPDMQIVVGGGIFNRAPGLAEEIGADLWASGPEDLMEQLAQYPEARADLEERTVGRGKAKAA
jgi:methanogenic corrinoid protein MtbC1